MRARSDWGVVEPRRIAALLARSFRGRSAIVFADQIMISASNFATGVILVRGLGLAEFGRYSIAYLLLLYANALQMSFISSPMLTIAPSMPSTEKRRFVEGMLTLQMFASVLLFIVFVLAGALSRIFAEFYSFPCIFAFSFCVGTFQLQDWVRRYYFLHNKGKFAITSDFISYCVQLVLVFVLWHIGSLTLFRTFLVMGLTSAAALIIAPITEEFRPTLQHLRETWLRCKVLSGSLFIANQVRWLSVQGVLLIGAGIVGTAAAGGLRAALNLAGPVYLVLMSLENILPIRLGEVLKERGIAGAYAFTKVAILGGTAFLFLLILPVGAFGRIILQVLYGPDMVAFYLPMLLQLLSIVVQIVATLWYHFYRSVQDTRALLWANALSAITSISTVYLFGHLWNASGIVLSYLAGQLIIVAYYMLHWWLHRDELLLSYPAPNSSRVDAAMSFALDVAKH